MAGFRDMSREPDQSCPISWFVLKIIYYVLEQFGQIGCHLVLSIQFAVSYSSHGSIPGSVINRHRAVWTNQYNCRPMGPFQFPAVIFPEIKWFRYSEVRFSDLYCIDLGTLMLQFHCYNFVHDDILKHWDTILEAFFHFCFALVIKFLSALNDFISFITWYFDDKCLRSSFLK